MENTSNILTVKEVADILRCSKAHVPNAIHGKVHGLPKLTHLTMGRRKLVRRDWLTQEKDKRMRRKRFQRGCLKTRKRNGKNYWYASGGRMESPNRKRSDSAPRWIG